MHVRRYDHEPRAYPPDRMNFFSTQQQQQQAGRGHGRSSNNGNIFANMGQNMQARAANPNLQFQPQAPANMRAQAAYMEEQRRRELEQARRERGPPPASSVALKNIPDVKIAAHDLAEETNRSCSVCLEDHELGEMAVKLPCAHIFHRDCVWEWLELHCTCPVCRFELETADRNYEKERKLRMQGRRPRYRRRELESLSIPQIRNLARGQNVSIAGCLEKKDIVRRIVDSGRVELIEAINPEYNETELSEMSARQLRSLMLQVGIDVQGCLEKQDLLERVRDSGLVTVTHGEANDSDSVRPSSPPPPPPPPPTPPMTTTYIPHFNPNHTASTTGATSTGGGQAQGGLRHGSSGDHVPAVEREEASSRRPWWLGGRRAPRSPTPAAASRTAAATARTEPPPPVELESMSVKDLRVVMSGLGISMVGCIEKRDMVERIRGSGRYRGGAGGGAG